MKKTILLVFLIISMSINSQTRTIGTKLKVKDVPIGSKSDSLLVQGSDQIFKLISRGNYMNDYATQLWVANQNYLTSFDITTQTDNKYLRSNTSDVMSGDLTLNKLKANNLTTGNNQILAHSTDVIFVGNPATRLTLESNTPNLYLYDGSDQRKIFHEGNFVAGIDYQAPLSNVAKLDYPNIFTINQQISNGTHVAILDWNELEFNRNSINYITASNSLGQIGFRTGGTSNRYVIDSNGNHNFVSGTAKFGNIVTVEAGASNYGLILKGTDRYSGIRFQDYSGSSDMYFDGTLGRFTFGTSKISTNNTITATDFIGKWNGETKSQLLNNSNLLNNSTNGGLNQQASSINVDSLGTTIIYGGSNITNFPTSGSLLSMMHTAGAYGGQLHVGATSSSELSFRGKSAGVFTSWRTVATQEWVDTNSSKFLRSDVDDSLEGKILTGSSSDRQAGIYGNYNAGQLQNIWGMGTQYNIALDGSNYGNFYGAAYEYSATLRAKGHQFNWAQNGVVKVSLGDNIWTSGIVTATNFIGNWNGENKTQLLSGLVDLTSSQTISNNKTFKDKITINTADNDDAKIVTNGGYDLIKYDAVQGDFWLNNGGISNTSDRYEFNQPIVSTAYRVSNLNTAPSSSTDTGSTGDIRYTADYIYICVATNTWKRSALTTW